MRQKKTRKLPPKGQGGTKLTTEQIMQLVAKQHPKIIAYLGSH
jgi:hypothetical protein